MIFLKLFLEARVCLPQQLPWEKKPLIEVAGCKAEGQADREVTVPHSEAPGPV